MNCAPRVPAVKGKFTLTIVLSEKEKIPIITDVLIYLTISDQTQHVKYFNPLNILTHTNLTGYVIR